MISPFRQKCQYLLVKQNNAWFLIRSAFNIWLTMHHWKYIDCTDFLGHSDAIIASCWKPKTVLFTFRHLTTVNSVGAPICFSSLVLSVWAPFEEVFVQATELWRNYHSDILARIFNYFYQIKKNSCALIGFLSRSTIFTMVRLYFLCVRASGIANYPDLFHIYLALKECIAWNDTVL